MLRRLNGIHKEFKDSICGEMEPGDKRTVKKAQGLELGSESKSAPGMKAVCTDSAVILAMVEEQGREIVDGLPVPSDPRHEEIVRLLMEIGRRDLLESAVVKEDADAIAAKVLEGWQLTGDLPAPLCSATLLAATAPGTGRYRRPHPLFVQVVGLFCVEGMTGIEPASSAWKAEVLATIRHSHNR